VKGQVTLVALTVVQVGCAFFFVSDILLTVFGARTAPISWQTRELLEIGAAVGLSIGVVLGLMALSRNIKRSEAAEESLKTVQMAFHDHLEQKFSDWALTAAERDVALFTIKGLSLAEIADIRQTSEGTVKAQSNAIYRKSGVKSRAQLLSLFIDDLIGDD
jgi:DNA-binding CsgD family transcriptional regulator